jgi:CRISPR-associated endonuclease/helicase Cas3
VDYKVYHLSARMTLIHRKNVVFSTQIMEAGIDVDFNCCVWALVGLDSTIQAAGRINRNGTLKDNEGNSRKVKLYIYNFNDNLIDLDYIKESKTITKNILKRIE